MYYNIVMDFFKRNNLYDEEMFDYINKHTFSFDYREEELRVFIGCAFELDKNDVLKKFSVCMPYISDYKTALICIHEMIHAIMGYKYLGKKFIIKDNIEAISFLYEQLFIIEINNQELIDFVNDLDKFINEKSEFKYRFALEVRDYLLDTYDADIDHVDKVTRKLAKRRKFMEKYGRFLVK